MSKGTVNITIEEYDYLRDLKKDIESEMVLFKQQTYSCIDSEYTYTMSKDDAINELSNKCNKYLLDIGSLKNRLKIQESYRMELEELKLSVKSINALKKEPSWFMKLFENKQK